MAYGRMAPIEGVRLMDRKWRLTLLMAAGVCLNYIDRVNVSHAVVPMAAELHLSPVAQGVILSAFSWGYVLFMMLGGLLVDRKGPVIVAGLAAAVWSVATALTAACNSSLGLVLSRVAVGLGEAPLFPANARIVREDFGPGERGRATAIFDAGSYVGTALAAPLVVYLIAVFGWRGAFFVCAVLGLFWVASWFRLAPLLRYPAYSYAEPSLPGVDHAALIQLLRDRRIIGASLGFFCYNYAKSFFLTWLPSYLVKERGMAFLAVGYVATFPPLCAIVGGLAAGLFTDMLIRRGTSVTLARKLPICTGLLLSSTVAAVPMTPAPWLAVSLLSFAFAATISASPGIWAIPGDIAPNSGFVGTIGGIQNTISNIAGLVAPIVTGALLSMTGSFGLALTVSAIVCCAGAFCYAVVVGPLTPIVLAGRTSELNEQHSFSD